MSTVLARTTIFTLVLFFVVTTNTAHASTTTDLLAEMKIHLEQLSLALETKAADSVAGKVRGHSTDYHYVVNEGTTRSSMPYPRGGNDNLSQHGFRFVCVPSHYSYDDPVVYPGQAGRAHLHMFFGNTDTNYESTTESIVSSGATTCAGGTLNRSSYWVPALMNEAGEPVLPYAIVNYYKSWVSDRSQLQPVPVGLQILANGSILGSSGVTVARPGHSGDANNASIRVNDHDGLTITILFPDCIAVDSAGDPILTSPGGTSHVAYSNGDGCPTSHPYLIPQLTQNINWRNVPYSSDWQLASDPSPAAKGTTAHADYIAAWPEEATQIMVECIRDGYRECGPDLTAAMEQDLSYDPSGEQLYRYMVLLDSADATPMNVWPKSLSGDHSTPPPVTEPITAPDEEPEPIVPDEEPNEAPVVKDTPETVTPKKETETEGDAYAPKNEKATETAKNRIRTVDNLKVRTTPGGTEIAIMPRGSVGTVLSKTPITQGNYNWIKVQFSNGTEGYVADAFTTPDGASTTNAPTISADDRNTIMAKIQALLAQVSALQALLKQLQTVE